MAIWGNDGVEGAYPHGNIVVFSASVAIQASKTDYVWDIKRFPFAAIIKEVEIFSIASAGGAGKTVDVAVIDNDAAEVVVVQNEALADITEGAAAMTSLIRATIVAGVNTTIRAGAGLLFRYTSGSGDTSVGT